MVLGTRRHPRRRALEDGDAFGLRRDLRHGLEGARAGADDGDALALEVVLRFPLAGVEGDALEIIATRNVGELGPVELAHGGDDGVRSDGALAVRAAHGHAPEPVVAVAGGDHFGAEADVLAQFVFAGDAVEVVEQHALLGEVLGPVVGGEGVGVGVVRAIHAAARIAVLEPGAADASVLVEDGPGDAGLLQANGVDEARHAGAHDDDVEVLAGLRGDVLEAFDPVRVFVDELELGAEELHVVGRKLRADDEVQHLLHHFR